MFIEIFIKINSKILKNNYNLWYFFFNLCVIVLFLNNMIILVVIILIKVENEIIFWIRFFKFISIKDIESKISIFESIVLVCFLKILIMMSFILILIIVFNIIDIGIWSID